MNNQNDETITPKLEPELSASKNDGNVKRLNKHLSDMHKSIQSMAIISVSQLNINKTQKLHNDKTIEAFEMHEQKIEALQLVARLQGWVIIGILLGMSWFHW